MNTKENVKRNISIILYILLSICSFALILIIPSSREIFKTLSGEHPFIMGFVKFALLATAGELIAVRIAKKRWALPAKIVCRFIIWGFIGVWITFMMKVFSGAVSSITASGLVYGKDSAFLKALYTSVIMNTSFGPTFMAAHKCTDMYLELKSTGKPCKIGDVIKNVDWTKFVTFTIFKTVPLFWIPAHTVTFMLPSEYQVIMAASLSVALGIILSIKK